MTKLEYVVTVPSELAAGIRGFTEHVAVTFEHTDKAVDDAGMRDDLVEHFREALAEWFDVNGKCIATLDEYVRREGRHTWNE